MKKTLLYFIIFIPIAVLSQNTIEGKVFDTEKNPIFGANIYWLNTSVGVISQDDGSFEIAYKNDYKKLIISHIGHKTDTLEISSAARLEIVLESENTLSEVTVKSKKKPITRSAFEVANVINVNKDELLKAACCNLAESFETNPSIDVNFSDALTGTKQIKMLGLKSPYIQIIQENIPNVRGAAQTYGLSFTPGTWIESIQITKGAGSVINGYESISGQINSELVKPLTDKKLFVNAFGSLNGRIELNTHFNKKISEKLHTGLYVHGNLRNKKIDDNNDTFLDAPLSEQINIMNRWQLIDTEKGWVSFVNLRYLKDSKQIGQVDFRPSRDKGTENFWGSEIKTDRFEASTKLGYVYAELPYQSFGIQLAYSNYNQESYFGLKDYNIKHQSLFANFIFNSIISDTRNKFSTGINAVYDDFDEYVIDTEYLRQEKSIGAFFEYNFDNLDKINFSAGLRIDTHNLLGTFITPRFHLKYTPFEKSTFRLSFGRGKRSTSIFSENQSLFSTNRTIIIENNNGEYYGLKPEIAWNYGMSFSQKFKLFNKTSEFTIDFYKTNFVEQIVVDWENPEEISFYNSHNKGKALSFQFELTVRPFKHFSIRSAYKYQKTTNEYKAGELDVPLQPKNRFFSNISYETPHSDKGGKWKFDFSYNWLDKQRIMDTSVFSPEYQLPNYSDSHSTINTQITKVFSENFELYFGGENLTNHKQKTPVLGADNPFGENFDASVVYSPVLGTMFYSGIRYNIN